MTENCLLLLKKKDVEFSCVFEILLVKGDGHEVTLVSAIQTLQAS